MYKTEISEHELRRLILEAKDAEIRVLKAIGLSHQLNEPHALYRRLADLEVRCLNLERQIKAAENSRQSISSLSSGAPRRQQQPANQRENWNHFQIPPPTTMSVSRFKPVHVESNDPPTFRQVSPQEQVQPHQLPIPQRGSNNVSRQSLHSIPKF